MGGRIGFESTPRTGSRFWFDIELEQLGSEPEAGAVETLRGCRILRLCPGEPLETLASRCLKSWGLAYQDVTGTQDAVSRLIGVADDADGFDILILDGISITPPIEHFIAALGQELGLYGLSALLLPPAPVDTAVAKRLSARAHLLSPPLDKALLFNALHAAYAGAGTDADDGRIISFSERLERRRAVRKGIRVLVAEDNATNRMVIGRILERAGIDHRLVNDGQAVLDALEQERFDLAIVDMQMPVLSGIAAYKLYRFAHAGEPAQIPFIVLTANATVEAQADARDAGIAQFLTKPVSSSRLIESINRTLDASSAAASSEPPTPPPSRTAEIDPAQLESLRSLACDEGFAERLLASFADDGRELLANIASALDRGDWGRARDQAHALKGSAANLGLTRLREQAVGLERDSDTELSTKGTQRLESLSRELERGLDTLRGEIGRPAGKSLPGRAD